MTGVDVDQDGAVVVVFVVDDDADDGNDDNDDYFADYCSNNKPTLHLINLQLSLY